MTRIARERTVTLEDDQLVFRFPEIAEDAETLIDFQRTLRIPDDGETHFLPPGLGSFPLRHVEDFDLGENEHLKARGGIIMPMFQVDALWLNFYSTSSAGFDLPVALKIGAGKINAISGRKWQDGLSRDPQNYVVVPGQPWLDGFNVGKGVIRQFVAVPLGQGYTVEEQIDPDSEVGGIQIEAIPMRKSRYRWLLKNQDLTMRCQVLACEPMGLGMGGSMRQHIYEDEYGISDWDLDKRQRCFVMIANAEQWMSITGEEPPLSPISAHEYTQAGLPWFDYYDGDKKAIKGAKALGKLKSIKELAGKKRDPLWPEDQPVVSPVVQKLGADKVSDGSW